MIHRLQRYTNYNDTQITIYKLQRYTNYVEIVLKTMFCTVLCGNACTVPVMSVLAEHCGWTCCFSLMPWVCLHPWLCEVLHSHDTVGTPQLYIVILISLLVSLPRCSSWSPFIPCLSRRAQSSRRISFSRRTPFTESHAVLVIFFLLIDLFIHLF